MELHIADIFFGCIGLGAFSGLMVWLSLRNGMAVSQKHGPQGWPASMAQLWPNGPRLLAFP
jgi:hypothetical protein